MDQNRILKLLLDLTQGSNWQQVANAVRLELEAAIDAFITQGRYSTDEGELLKQLINRSMFSAPLAPESLPQFYPWVASICGDAKEAAKLAEVNWGIWLTYTQQRRFS